MILVVIVLLVCIGVGSYLCPSSSSVMQMGIASFALWKTDASSASTVNNMTCLIIFASTRMGPLVQVSFLSPKKW